MLRFRWKNKFPQLDMSLIPKGMREFFMRLKIFYKRKAITFLWWLLL
jgi:hypothetical protein